MYFIFSLQIRDERQMSNLPAEDWPGEDAALRRLRSRPPHVLPQAKAQVRALRRLVLSRLQAERKTQVINKNFSVEDKGYFREEYRIEQKNFLFLTSIVSRTPRLIKKIK